MKSKSRMDTVNKEHDILLGVGVLPALPTMTPAIDEQPNSSRRYIRQVINDLADDPSPFLDAMSNESLLKLSLAITHRLCENLVK